MKVRAYAKLNLYLEILGKTDHGYHTLRSIMHKIQLHDRLEIRRADHDSFSMNDHPADEHNLIVKALHELRKHVAVPPVMMRLEKHIPSGAGLGGGSSDAATVLMSLNRLFDLELSKEKLGVIASALGSDIPFFFASSAALVEGTGTKVTPLPFIDLPHILLARAKGSLSTAKVYQETRPEDYTEALDYARFSEAIKTHRLDGLGNHLEAPAFRLDENTKHLKERLRETGADYTLMSGSGNVVFAVYPDEKTARKAKKTIAPYVAWSVLTKTTKDSYV